jgi:hypothetical protein
MSNNKFVTNKNMIFVLPTIKLPRSGFGKFKKKIEKISNKKKQKNDNFCLKIARSKIKKSKFDLMTQQY